MAAAVSTMPRDLSAGSKPPPPTSTSTSTSTSTRAPPPTTTSSTKSSKTPDFLKPTSISNGIKRIQRIEEKHALHPNSVTREPPSSNYQPRDVIAPYYEPVYTGTGPAPVPVQAPETKRRRLSMNQKHALPPRPNVNTPPTPSIGSHAERQSRWHHNGPKATGANAIASTMPLFQDALARARKSPKGNTSPPGQSWQLSQQHPFGFQPPPQQQQLPGWQTFQQHQQQQQQYGYQPYAQGQFAYAQPQQQHGFTPPQPYGQLPPYQQQQYGAHQQHGAQSSYSRGNQSPYQRGNQSPYGQHRGGHSPFQQGGRSPAVREDNRSPLPLGQRATASGGSTPRPASGGRTPPPPLKPLPSRAAPPPREHADEAEPPSSGAPLTPPHSPTPPPPYRSPPPPPAKSATPKASPSAGMRALDRALDGLRQQRLSQNAAPVVSPYQSSTPVPARPAPAPEPEPRVFAAPVAAVAAVAPSDDERVARALKDAAELLGHKAPGSLGLDLDRDVIAKAARDFADALEGKGGKSSDQLPTPLPATATDVPEAGTLRPNKRARTESPEIDQARPGALFFEAPFVKLEDEDFSSLPNVPTQDDLWGSEPEDDPEPIFEEEEDELDSDSDEDVKPYIDPRRQNPDMDVSDSEDDDSEEEDIDDEPIDVDAPATTKTARAKKRAKRAKLLSEAICAGQCFRCPSQPLVADMYNHLCLDHRFDTLSPQDFKCDKIRLCECGRPAIKSTYTKNHLKFCSLPLERRVALGMAPPKEKKVPTSKAGTCHLCDKSLKDLLGHFKRKHANINVTDDDFDCPGLKACCGKVWTKGGRHKCPDSSNFTRPSAASATPSPVRAANSNAARATSVATAVGRPQQEGAQATPGQGPTTAETRRAAESLNTAPLSRFGKIPKHSDKDSDRDGRNRRLSGEDGRPGELPDRLRFLNNM
ncbi:hypothetical protein A1Q2_05771 [Trichosporon asahii var. asahii CBS 8904]|uniref:Uncharacterized protein n=1 Tax=Trichosporon asahii var. asahii (strain CBS 8904) TaxID=1220162 RepID=K1VTD0_TRIAC|nr:hypothetical protein A1Q2_05771 [Trichosporon asahii var. asahii CBS 8904]